jgi:hypothetical protein
LREAIQGLVEVEEFLYASVANPDARARDLEDQMPIWRQNLKAQREAMNEAHAWMVGVFPGWEFVEYDVVEPKPDSAGSEEEWNLMRGNAYQEQLEELDDPLKFAACRDSPAEIGERLKRRHQLRIKFFDSEY